MSITIYVSCVILLFSSIISALPTPKDVYSAVIYNKQDSRIQCTIAWLTPLDTELQRDRITIEKDDHYKADEKIFVMDKWTARAIIKRIRCGNLILVAPFPNVNGIETNWEFRVEPNSITSVRP